MKCNSIIKKEKGLANLNKLLLRINEKAQVTIVTCGSCGYVLLQDNTKEEDLTCPHCGYESECCDFPDLFY